MNEKLLSDINEDSRIEKVKREVKMFKAVVWQLISLTFTIIISIVITMWLLQFLIETYRDVVK